MTLEGLKNKVAITYMGNLCFIDACVGTKKDEIWAKVLLVVAIEGVAQYCMFAGARHAREVALKRFTVSDALKSNGAISKQAMLLGMRRQTCP